MLTTLPTLHARLGITDSANDALLTSAIKSVSARFDKLTNRTVARTENATFELTPTDTELAPPCYPIESATRWETKSSEADGWQETTPAPAYLIRHSCIISLCPPFSLQPFAFSLVCCVARRYGPSPCRSASPALPPLHTSRSTLHVFPLTLRRARSSPRRRHTGRPRRARPRPVRSSPVGFRRRGSPRWSRPGIALRQRL